MTTEQFLVYLSSDDCTHDLACALAEIVEARLRAQHPAARLEEFDHVAR
jgi:hypothetical protein